MPPVKKIKLPPKPVAKESKSAVVVPKPKDPRDLTDLKAVDYVITLDDGSALRATGEHADLIYRYLTECEKHCSEQQLVNYLGPSLTRYDAEGKRLAQGAALSAGIRS